MHGHEVEMVAAVPSPPVRRLVASYTGYRIRGAEPGVHRGLPSRHLTMIITIDGTVDLATDGGPPLSFHALAAGLHAWPVLIEHDGHQHGVQLGLTPLGARALLGPPAGELAGAAIDLGALLGPVAGELVERLRSATGWRDRFAQLDQVLARIALPHSEPRAELAWAWRRLARSGGAVEVGDLAAEVGWSRQYLGRRFRDEYGLSPKTAARVMRFEVARELLGTPGRPDLAQVAATAGYYDQAHLNRDWREFTGVAPSTWLAEELPFVQDATRDQGPS
jgi:AraC-like DNA-binding protein